MIKIEDLGDIFCLRTKENILLTSAKNMFSLSTTIDTVTLHPINGGKVYSFKMADFDYKNVAKKLREVIFQYGDEEVEINEYGKGLYLNPSVHTVENRFIRPNNNEDIIIIGGCFDIHTEVEVIGQTVNRVTYVNDTRLIVNVTTNSNEGKYDIVVRNEELETKIIAGLQVGPVSLETIEWKVDAKSSNAEISKDGFTLEKTTKNGWNCGSISNYAINDSNGYLEFEPFYPKEGHRRYMLGLSYTDKHFSHSDIQFGIYFNSRSIHVYESGRNVQNLGQLQDGDVFKIEIKDGSIIYKKNNIFVYRSKVEKFEFPLFADCSIYDQLSITDVKLFGNLIEI